tara:strand:- start:444 stop:680 length:237 start_codon:yes stop_codon:yes gene_type:complete
MDNLDKDHLRALERAYSKMVQPSNLIEYFNTTEEFTEWAELGSPSDLRAALIAFEKDELYDHCKILKAVLVSKEQKLI